MTLERGRPREFAVDEALDRALQVFWQRGFQAASLTDLTTAMDLSKPSLYAAFGNKEGLYLAALERYGAQHMTPHFGVLQNEPDGRLAVEKYLRSMAAMFADPALPGGCFVINGSADLGGAATPEAVELALKQALIAIEALMTDRLQRAQRDGQLPPGADTTELAAFFTSLASGLAVLGNGGAPLAKLEGVIRATMSAWPAPQSHA